MRRNKRKGAATKALVTGLVSIALVIFLALICVKWFRYKEAKFIRYKEFGIALPVNYMIHGIDVSRYQQEIAWSEVKEMCVDNIQLGFAFIKATEGEEDYDPCFKKSWKACRKKNIIRGAYHFFLPSKKAAKQAQNFISRVTLLPGDLPPVLDVEQLNAEDPAQLRANVKIWLQIVENHYKVKPILYTNADFYKLYLGKEFDAYPLWVAHYYKQQRPRIDRPWTFWQHNDRGNVNGITTKVDFNVFNGDSTEFRQLLIK